MSKPVSKPVLKVVMDQDEYTLMQQEILDLKKERDDLLNGAVVHQSITVNLMHNRNPHSFLGMQNPPWTQRYAKFISDEELCAIKSVDVKDQIKEIRQVMETTNLAHQRKTALEMERADNLLRIAKETIHEKQAEIKDLKKELANAKKLSLGLLTIAGFLASMLIVSYIKIFS